MYANIHRNEPCVAKYNLQYVVGAILRRGVRHKANKGATKTSSSIDTWKTQQYNVNFFDGANETKNKQRIKNR